MINACIMYEPLTWVWWLLVLFCIIFLMNLSEPDWRHDFVSIFNIFRLIHCIIRMRHCVPPPPYFCVSAFRCSRWRFRGCKLWVAVVLPTFRCWRVVFLLFNIFFVALLADTRIECKKRCQESSIIIKNDVWEFLILFENHEKCSQGRFKRSPTPVGMLEKPWLCF